MKGRRRRQPNRAFFKGPIKLVFRDRSYDELFAIDVEGEPWTLDEGDTFNINLNNCAITDLDNGQHVIILPVASP